MVLTAANHDPADAQMAALYADLAERASFAFTASVACRIYARHGTTTDTRLTVIDRVPGLAPLVPAGHAASLAELLALIEAKLPPRLPLSSFPAIPKTAQRSAAVTSAQPRPQTRSHLPASSQVSPDADEIRYEAREAVGRADRDRHLCRRSPRRTTRRPLQRR